MPLHLLLDEHVSPRVGRAIERMQEDVPVTSLRDWRDGAYLGVEDELLIPAAASDHLTLVTYDRRTMVPLLARIAAAEGSHGGVVLVDERTVAPNDVGGLARALVALWEALGSEDWTNRVVYPTE